MSKMEVFLAVDLGASSGRVVAGKFDEKVLELEEVHRFPNGGVHVQDSLHWDILALWQHIQDGLRKAAAAYGDSIKSIGVDTWGVDFGFLGRNDELLGNPYCYRDHRTNGIFDAAFDVVPKHEIFADTGVQFMELNSLYQWWAMQRANSAILDSATSLLMIPDLFNWLLTGEKSNEETNASTTQFYNPKQKAWAADLLNKFDLNADLLGELTPPGTVLGTVRRRLAEDLNLKDVQVVLPGTHDTASAVAAVPAAGAAKTSKPNWCYISSGTWSLMGTEVSKPVINDKCLELNFTNEGGVGGTTRLLKNIAGLWLVQECRRIWAQAGNDLSWSELVSLAKQSPPLLSIIDPDDPVFVSPRNMPEAIQTYCRNSGQLVPESEGAIIRCVLESLAMRYRAVLNWSEELTGSKIKRIHIVGGGTQNELLSQMTADACNRLVVAGPVEATAIGNVMMQAVAVGTIDSIKDSRSAVLESFTSNDYEPQSPDHYDDAFERFKDLTNK